jgi:arginine repressor
MTEKVEEGVKNRLIKYLIKDKIGIRKCLLMLFLQTIQTKSYTTCEIYDYLKKRGFDVNYKGVSAMVGQMHSRLGILRIYLNKEHNFYCLKEKHGDVVKMVLNNYSARMF